MPTEQPAPDKSRPAAQKSGNSATADLRARCYARRMKKRGGELAQSLGVSYEVSPTILVGAELLHEIDIPDWSETEDSVLYGGPKLPTATRIGGRPLLRLHC